MCINKQLVQLPWKVCSFVFGMNSIEMNGMDPGAGWQWLLLQAAIDLIDKPPKSFCSEEGRAKEQRAISEAALSNVPVTGSFP